MNNGIRHLSRTAAVAAFLVSAMTVAPMQAHAWGAKGHEYVGNLASSVLNPRARAQVKALLGSNVTLGKAAVWADCLRSLSGSPTTSLTFEMGGFTPQACSVFNDHGAEEARMVDYATRNWTNCVYAGDTKRCHLAYHFADVNLWNRTDYQLGYFGTASHDVVQAINAAVTVLRCPARTTCPTAAPFDIRDRREALLLLAHFAGDVHQPLHVGAVYLTGDNREGDDTGEETIGGNRLLLVPGDKDENLHHEWDTVSGTTTPSAKAIASACAIAPLPNPTFERPEAWATQSVVAARAAYKGLTYAKDTALNGYWDLSFADAAGYAKARRGTQAVQMITAGARLAATLNAVWPSTHHSQAC